MSRFFRNSEDRFSQVEPHFVIEMNDRLTSSNNEAEIDRQFVKR